MSKEKTQKEEINEKEIKITSKDKNKETKKKFNIKYLIIGVVILIIGVLLLFLFKGDTKSNKNNGTKILIYTNSENDLKYISSKSDKPVLLSKSFDENIDVEFNSKRNKIAYIKNKGLYLHNIDTDEESDKIGVDIELYDFINDDELAYLDNSKNLYVGSSSTNKAKIDIDVTDFGYINEKMIIYAKKEEIYLYNLETKEKNAVLKDYNNETRIWFSEDRKQIMYISKDAELKTFNIETKKTEVLDTNVVNVVHHSNDFSKIYYFKKGGSKTYYELFVNDDTKDNPIKKHKCVTYKFNEKIWDWDDHRTKKSDPKNNTYYLYDYYGYVTWLDSNGELKNLTTEIYDICHGKDSQAKLKNQIRKDKTSVQLYDMYLLETGEPEIIAQDVYRSVYDTDDIILYTKLDIKKENKRKISSFSSVDELKHIIDDINPTLYYSNGNKNDELLTYNYDLSYKDNISIVGKYK